MTRIQIYYPLNGFEIVATNNHIVDWLINTSVVSWRCPLQAIYDLRVSGVTLNTIKGMSTKWISVLNDGTAVVHEDAKTKKFNSVQEAISYFTRGIVKFKVGKMYRFIYNGGTRQGQKRAVKVDDVMSTYIAVTDLDTGEARNYTLSKISDAEEIV